jgi:thioredoxin:protein disulfide reductase
MFSTLWKMLILASLSALSAAASPFTVTAGRAEHDGAPALRVAFDFPEDHYLYESFSIATPDGAALEPLSVPEARLHKPEDLEPSHAKPFAAYYAPPAADSIVVTYQGCKGSLCFMPEEVTLDLSPAASSEPARALAEPAAAESPAPADGSWQDLLQSRGTPRTKSASSEPPEFLAFLDPATATESADVSAWRQFLDDPASFYLRFGVWPSILLILIGGFLLNLTPCVLPMIPINLAIIGASSMDVSRRGRFGLGLVYGLGMALVYGALGLAVVLFGAVFGTLQASPVFNGVIALVFLALGLAMFDVWQLDFSRFRKTGGGLSGRARLPAVLGLGGLSAILAGACVAPVLIAVLALSGSLYAGDAKTIAVLLPFLLGVGMALPWPLAAAGLAVLPKPGAWMEKVKKGFGILILLLAVFYGWNTYRALRPAAPAPKAAAEAGDADLFRTVVIAPGDDGGFEAVVRDAVASGKPILFNFGATWCVECKIMDAGTLRDPAVVAKLQDFYAIKVIADQPRRPPARELLEPFAIPGFPTYVIYPAAQ